MTRCWRAVDGVLLLDKPSGCTSNSALQRVRRLYRAEKAGHTGSLDPIATGLLPICFGEATKIASCLLDSGKRYWVRAKLGEKTTTGDLEGDVVARTVATDVQREDIERVLPDFTGRLRQVPPMVSALKHQGERLYEIARRGQEVLRTPREIQIEELRLVAFENPYFEMDVRCSKGTYIRSLVEDLAAALGQQAHVHGLRRTALSPFDAPVMHTMDELEYLAAGDLSTLDRLLLPPAAALAHRPSIRVDEDQARRMALGQAIRLSVPVKGDLVVLDPNARLLGLAEGDVEGCLQPRRWLQRAGKRT